MLLEFQLTERLLKVTLSLEGKRSLISGKQLVSLSSLPSDRFMANSWRLNQGFTLIAVTMVTLVIFNRSEGQILAAGPLLLHLFLIRCSLSLKRMVGRCSDFAYRRLFIITTERFYAYHGVERLIEIALRPHKALSEILRFFIFKDWKTTLTLLNLVI